MMHGRGKLHSAIVAVKPTNKAVQSVAEPVERSAEAEGNAGQQSTRRAQNLEACPRRWSAYGKSQGKGRRRGSPLSCTISTLICCTVLRTEEERCARRGRTGMEGLRSRP